MVHFQNQVIVQVVVRVGQIFEIQHFQWFCWHQCFWHKIGFDYICSCREYCWRVASNTFHTIVFQEHNAYVFLGLLVIRVIDPWGLHSNSRFKKRIEDIWLHVWRFLGSLAVVCFEQWSIFPLELRSFSSVLKDRFKIYQR